MNFAPLALSAIERICDHWLLCICLVSTLPISDRSCILAKQPLDDIFLSQALQKRWPEIRKEDSHQREKLKLRPFAPPNSSTRQCPTAHVYHWPREVVLIRLVVLGYCSLIGHFAIISSLCLFAVTCSWFLVGDIMFPLSLLAINRLILARELGCSLVAYYLVISWLYA